MYTMRQQKQIRSISAVSLLALLSLFLFTPVQARSIEECRTALADKHRLTAYETCLPLAQTGDPDAAFLVAGLYALGVGLHGEKATPDLSTAVKWLQIAAANGHAEATYNLGVAYHHGKGVRQSLPEAIKVYRRAAELGNGKAMRNLATLYETGQGFEQDLVSAFILYEQSAQTGLSDSQLKTALMLLSGEGVAADPIKARFWLNLSARNENPTAQLTLGVILAETEPATSLYWYRKAARQNNPYAAHNLALTYYRSLVDKDLFMALAYADLSVSLGNEKSQDLYNVILTELQSADMLLQAPVIPNTTLQSVDWLRQQPAHRYVIQLARLHTEASASQFIEQYKIAKIARGVAMNSQQTDYVVISRLDFDTEAEARAQIAGNLPQSLQSEAWVRNYGSLQ